MATHPHRKVIIIGSGPAGLTAAVYAARASLAPLVIEGEPSSTSDQPGGQLMLTTEVENFPGFPEGVQGPELMQRMRDQAARFGAEFLTEKATKIDFSGRPHRVWVRDDEYSADAVIVSTGARSLMLGLPNETALIGHGVSTCATCDGFFFRPRNRGGWRRRLGDRRSVVPHQVRHQGHAHPPPREVPCFQDHAGARVQQPENLCAMELAGHQAERRQEARVN
jgi:alkyl hydroperoxide reductase subunit AhpF